MPIRRPDSKSDQIQPTTPAGAVSLYAASPAPEGWLLCDGSAVNRTTYPNLFAAIGTTFGNGNGSTTFNIPDLQGRIPVGRAGAGGHTDVTSLGNNEGVALANRRPKHKHSHTLSVSGGNHGHTVSDPGHTHNHGNANDGGSFDNQAGAGSTNILGRPVGGNTTGVSIGQSTHTHPTGEFSGTIGASSSDAQDSQPFLVMNYIIKV